MTFSEATQVSDKVRDRAREGVVWRHRQPQNGHHCGHGAARVSGRRCEPVPGPAVSTPCVLVSGPSVWVVGAAGGRLCPEWADSESPPHFNKDPPALKNRMHAMQAFSLCHPAAPWIARSVFAWGSFVIVIRDCSSSLGFLCPLLGLHSASLCG